MANPFYAVRDLVWPAELRPSADSGPSSRGQPARVAAIVDAVCYHLGAMQAGAVKGHPRIVCVDSAALGLVGDDRSVLTREANLELQQINVFVICPGKDMLLVRECGGCHRTLPDDAPWKHLEACSDVLREKAAQWETERIEAISADWVRLVSAVGTGIDYTLNCLADDEFLVPRIDELLKTARIPYRVSFSTWMLGEEEPLPKLDFTLV